MSSNRKSTKSVRFSAESKPEATNSRSSIDKRRRDDDDDDDERGHIRVKKKRLDRMNEDEMDDVDDWKAEDDDGGDGNDGLPSIREREKAKRARRQNREHGVMDHDDDDDDDGDGIESTSIDERTSLASEGIQIEPFHMRQEQSDGTGFFDGDTYVFRKRDADEEPDAWLESLKDTAPTTTTNPPKSSMNSESDDPDMESMNTESLTKEEWYAKILNLVSDTETIMQAVIRYGSLLKRQPLKRNKAKKHDTAASKTKNTEENPQASEAFQFAQTSLNDLTEAANALLGMGDIDIYQKTRNDLLKLIPNNNNNQEGKEQETATQNQQSADTTSNNVKDKPQVSWEYKGSQDGQIHGPYTSEQMRDWTRAGYFVGAQAVQIRSVQKEDEKEKDLGQDLLSDLMDDDDDEDDNKKDCGDSSSNMVRGEWVLSDSVNFAQYC